MGRPIWVTSKGGERPNGEGGFWTDPPFTHGPYRVMSFRRFLPRGPVRDDAGIVVNERARSLVQVYTDPGGQRTMAVAEISFKDPGRARQ